MTKHRRAWSKLQMTTNFVLPTRGIPMSDILRELGPYTAHFAGLMNNTNQTELGNRAAFSTIRHPKERI